MHVEIKYSKHIDLVYHVLAYMHVNNASNLFDQSYINNIQKEKKDFELDLANEIKTLEQYYNDNFERVMLINFLPFYSNSFEELKEILLNSSRFTVKDKENFIKPFICLLEKESVFYFEYWQNTYSKTSYQRQAVECYLKDELSKYSCIFDHFNKDAFMYLSNSITRNGRGFGGFKSYFSAVIPLPKGENDFESAFFMLLHEYTHQFTDDLLKTNINMADGSHDLSERAVMLADYYLVKAIDYFSVEKYFNWIAKRNGRKELTELQFLAGFQIGDALETDLKSLLNSIVKIRE